MSTFGKLYRVTTYGESHCKSVGAIIDGVPPVRAWRQCAEQKSKLTDNQSQGLKLTEEDIQVQLSRRRPGQSDITTPVRRLSTPDLLPVDTTSVPSSTLSTSSRAPSMA